MNEDGASGSCVVEAVLKLLENSKIFSSDHGFMRRIAYIETRDGKNKAESLNREMDQNIGIWGIRENMLHDMRVVIKAVALPLLCGLVDVYTRQCSTDTKYQDLIAESEQIYRRFDVNMTGDEKLNLRNSLVSGIAARFYLQYLTVLRNEEMPEDVAGQAFFWASHYHIDANTYDFQKGVMELEGMTKHSSLCDIIIPLMFYTCIIRLQSECRLPVCARYFSQYY